MIERSNPIVEGALRYPKAVMLVSVLLVLGLGALIPRIVIDTDPENMLPDDQAARVFHNRVKTDFTLYDLLVVGVANEVDPNGVFNPTSLARIHELTRHIEQIDGVIRQEILSLSTVDDVTPDGPGVVRFSWMMQDPPETGDEARAIREAAERNPVLMGTLVSEDGRAVGIYVPIVEKKESHRIASEIEAFIAGFEGDEQYFITGLPVAEDTFGVEMFLQMGIAAPLAGLVVFIMMWFFFRSFALITSPMLIALITVIATMGLLIGMGFTVHIMSSMIPIFLMPIAVVDSVHILSEFADRYSHIGDRHKTIRVVMSELFTPMLYTSLTSAVGFASLAFAPIPPVRVFGMFVAFGILLAFILTIVFVPAYIILLPKHRLAQLGPQGSQVSESGPLAQWLARSVLQRLGHARWVVIATLLLTAFSVWGIMQIRINDNPVRWFRATHPIRVADRVLNEHFGGTYNAYLVLTSDTPQTASTTDVDPEIEALLSQAQTDAGVDLAEEWEAVRQIAEEAPADEYIDALIDEVLYRLDEAEGAEIDAWEQVLDLLESGPSGERTFFQTPEGFQYIESLQAALLEDERVGKSNSVVDIVKTVHRAMREGDQQYFTVPESAPAIAQTLLTYQSSHRPNDLWHFLKPDYSGANIWVQLKSGDNQDMVEVTERVERYLTKHPPPEDVTVDWAGLTYLNVVWQQDMVNGMLRALLGSFVIVFIMMLVLFRSLWYGILAMLPLTVTIAFMYGMIGWVGKDYDMPIAVLSSLTLGLSIDFAIHFLQRTRSIQAETGDWKTTIRHMFDEPARAISRNAIVIAIGFLPLLLSPLIPYNTVGIFLAGIMAISCLVTLILLPSTLHLLRRRLFKSSETS